MARLAALAVALLAACSAQRQEYDECDTAELGQLRCAVGCPGGGTPCDAPEDIAAMCQKAGKAAWTRVAPCAACGEADGENAVRCGAEGFLQAVQWSRCEKADALACDVDGTAVLRCDDGEWLVEEFCDGRACGMAGNSIGCP